MIKKLKFQLVHNENNRLEFTSESEKVEIYVLEEDIFRVFMPFDKENRLEKTWTIAPGMEDVPFEGRDRFDISPFQLPAYTVEESEEKVEVYTGKLKAVIWLNGFYIDWSMKSNGSWVKVAGDRKTQSYNFNQSLGESVCHYMERDRSEKYYGLGEKGGLMDRHHKRYQMRTIDAMGYDAETTDPLYKHIPFYLVYQPELEASYGIFYDNYSDSIFDMGAELDNYHGFYRYYQAEKGDMDYYFILGPKISQVVERYTWMTGKTILPPKWSLGYSGSTMTYTDAPDAQQQLKKFVEDCCAFDIPCDSFQLSSGYTSIGDKRYVFNWNHSKVPEPVEMNKHFHENGIRVCANIKPCLLDDHPEYEDLKEQGLFIKNEDGSPEISQFWDAIGSYVDFTNPHTIQWWKDRIKETLLSYGIDSTWNDNNEYEIWDERATAENFGRPLSIQYVKPIQTLLMMKASFEAQQEYEQQKRPYLISRSGGPGMHRYVQTWSGDNFTEWKTIRYNLKMGLSLSLSGIYNFGHDIGGFAGKAPEPELFIRWIQNGIFHPRFTIHSWNEDKTVNVPWMYPEHMKIVRNLMKERVKWIPYFYHLLYEAHENYQPILAPTFYHFQDDERTFQENDEFMVGKDLLIASVMDKGHTQRELYLPENQNGWYDVETEDWYKGGRAIKVEAPLERIPKFAQAGSVFPIRDGEITFEQKEDTERGLLVFPFQGEGRTRKTFYEDDGVTLDYKEGIVTWLEIVMNTTEETIELAIKVNGDYKLPYSSLNVHFPEREKRTIVVNDKEIDQTSCELEL
ncbi:TIM-barrel domain-containing protein [Halobacillus sp. A5]|uniref:glycoside hydrolase family 31 protein n=1 Tax=Halobacillus sp. A5 TaxID=2880263 RepID=UPI0020A67B09|nr:glycoside hydrolase family 31 protein [Halobacillus sp. A5]